MKIKTSELTDQLLDCAVALASGYTLEGTIEQYGYIRWRTPENELLCYVFNPSTDRSQGGRISERNQIGTEWLGNEWKAEKRELGKPYKEAPSVCPIITKCMAYGPTPLVASMRCFVTYKFGDEVDIPDELLAEVPAQRTRSVNHG